MIFQWEFNSVINIAIKCIFSLNVWINMDSLSHKLYIKSFTVTDPDRLSTNLDIIHA